MINMEDKIQRQDQGGSQGQGKTPRKVAPCIQANNKKCKIQGTGHEMAKLLIIIVECLKAMIGSAGAKNMLAYAITESDRLEIERERQNLAPESVDANAILAQAVEMIPAMKANQAALAQAVGGDQTNALLAQAVQTLPDDQAQAFLAALSDPNLPPGVSQDELDKPTENE